jgi:ornithine carbamoyltransferase
MGMEIVLACPKGYQPDAEIVDRAREAGKGQGGRIDVVTDPVDAVKGADILYTDVWTSMGQEKELAKRVRHFQRYRIDASLLKEAAPEAIVMHCLPAHRGEEITEQVLEGEQSVVWDQAENRLYVQMALLELLMGGNG